MESLGNLDLGLGFRVYRFRGLGFIGLGFRGLGFRVWGLGVGWARRGLQVTSTCLVALNPLIELSTSGFQLLKEGILGASHMSRIM